MMKRGRPRKYQESIKCPECGSNWCKKFGKNTGKQRYKCNECGRIFYLKVKHRKHPEKIKLLALKMYSEGMSKSSIARVLNLPYGTVARWTYEAGKYLDTYLSKKWKKLAGNVDIDKVSIDEMRTYLKKNDEKHSVWIWTACIEKEGKKYNTMCMKLEIETRKLF
jgi:transposase-like protein